jgi:hypothetical protein
MVSKASSAAGRRAALEVRRPPRPRGRGSSRRRSWRRRRPASTRAGSSRSKGASVRWAAAFGWGGDQLDVGGELLDGLASSTVPQGGMALSPCLPRTMRRGSAWGRDRHARRGVGRSWRRCRRGRRRAGCAVAAHAQGVETVLAGGHAGLGVVGGRRDRDGGGGSSTAGQPRSSAGDGSEISLLCSSKKWGAAGGRRRTPEQHGCRVRRGRAAEPLTRG